jgi:hypothetical protein
MRSIETLMFNNDKALGLMETIWEDLSKTEVSAPAWHEQVLKETEDRVSKGLEKPVDWKEAKDQLRSRFA